MPKKTRASPETRICEAALSLAARQGWRQVTPDAVARAARLPPARVKKLFAERDDLLPAILRHIDQQVARACGKTGPRGAPHDRLFEVMMARFDALQEHRRAILAIMDETLRNPRCARFLMPAIVQSMRRMLTLARLKPEGIRGPVVVSGLLAVHGLAFCSWRRDSSADMSKTMAVLDRNLRRAASCAEILFSRA